MRASRIAHVATSPVVVGPSWAAVERVLWLAAVDRCLRATDDTSTDAIAADWHLRTLINRHAPSLYRATPVADAAESRWIIAARDAVDAGTPAERAAVVLWAAVASWTDAPSGRWGALADAGTTLAEALDAVTGEGRRTGRVATKLRGVMATAWAGRVG